MKIWIHAKNILGMTSSSNSWRNIALPRPQKIPTAKTLLTEFIIPKDVEQWSINWYSYFGKQLAYLVMLKTPIVFRVLLGVCLRASCFQGGHD